MQMLVLAVNKFSKLVKHNVIVFINQNIFMNILENSVSAFE